MGMTVEGRCPAMAKDEYAQLVRDIPHDIHSGWCMSWAFAAVYTGGTCIHAEGYRLRVAALTALPSTAHDGIQAAYEMGGPVAAYGALTAYMTGDSR